MIMWPFLPHIPNFHQVRDNIWRGGQPDKKGWLQLQALGVRTVIKLNTLDEAIDHPIGAVIRSFPITPEEQILGENLDDIIPAAAQAIVPFSFIHCGSDARTQSELDALLGTQGGQERTGAVCMYFRLLNGWSWQEAWDEMLSYGFHKFPTIGLTRWCERLKISGPLLKK